jgi:hypothetical protein
MIQNSFFLLIKYITIDLVGDFIYFPIWWYTRGLKKTLLFTGLKIQEVQNSLGVSVWAKNIFRPMYGQYDLQGRFISFLMRFFQLILRSIVFAFAFVFILVLPIIWIVLPIFVVFQIFLIISGNLV